MVDHASLLIAAFDGSTLETLKITQEAFSMEMSRSGANAEQPQRERMLPQAAEPASSAQAEETVNCITAPLVGTFYTAPAPDQPPFVTVGQQVQKGQTVGLIEAMKMMSEVTAPCACTIDRILVNNAELVEFGTPLFSYTPC